jgi:molybdopterin-guanine dinucleotide biosynthesis protein A
VRAGEDREGARFEVRRELERLRCPLIGVVLAGGRGSRLGGAKASLSLAGTPLIGYPIAALQAVAERVVVVAKPATELPPLAVERWDEPELPAHPVAGIRHALARGRDAVLVCAADMPFVTPDVLAGITEELRPGVTAAVAVCDGRLEPVLAAYAAEALEPLERAADDEPLRRMVESLAPVRVEVGRETVFNVNTPADLAEAERRLRS